MPSAFSVYFISRLTPGAETLSIFAAPAMVPVIITARTISICRSVLTALPSLLHVYYAPPYAGFATWLGPARRPRLFVFGAHLPFRCRAGPTDRPAMSDLELQTRLLECDMNDKLARLRAKYADIA